jgi:hypothetical protein
MQKGMLSRARASVPFEDALRCVRVSFIQRATLVRDGKSDDVLTLDLGLAGVFVECRGRLAAGQGVEIRFRLPGNDLEVVARCRVAWWRDADTSRVSQALPAGAGLEFVELSDADHRRLREHIAEHCRREPRARQFARRWPGEREGEDP